MSSKLRTLSLSTKRAFPYSPRLKPSLVDPSVNRSDRSEMRDQSPSGMVCSSKSTRGEHRPRGLIGVQGITCFCPESAIEANHSLG